MYPIVSKIASTPIADNRMKKIAVKVSIVCIGILCSRTWSAYNHCWILTAVWLCLSTTLLIELVDEGSIDIYRLSQGVDFINIHFYSTWPTLYGCHSIISIEFDFDSGISTVWTWIYIWNAFLWSSTYFLSSSSSHYDSPIPISHLTEHEPRKKWAGFAAQVLI